MGFPCLKKGVKEDGEEDEEHPYRPAEVDGEGGKGKGGEGTEAGCHDFHDLLHENGKKDADKVYRDKKEEEGTAQEDVGGGDDQEVGYDTEGGEEVEVVGNEGGGAYLGAERDGEEGVYIIGEGAVEVGVEGIAQALGAEDGVRGFVFLQQMGIGLVFGQGEATPQVLVEGDDGEYGGEGELKTYIEQNEGIVQQKEKGGDGEGTVGLDVVAGEELGELHEGEHPCCSLEGYGGTGQIDEEPKGKDE